MSDFQVEAKDSFDSAESVAADLVEEVISKSSGSSEFEGNLEEALHAKEQGNAHYRDKEYDAAIDSYSRAIQMCPKDERNKENLVRTLTQRHIHILTSLNSHESILGPTQAIFYGNRAACYSSIDATDLAIEDCTHALELKPEYVKVLMRRSQLYEKAEKLDEALADAKKTQEQEPTYPKIAKTVQRLEAASKEKFDKLKDEAMGILPHSYLLSSTYQELT